MSCGEVLQVQQARDQDSFKAGPTDGRWGNETQNAVEQFRQSEQMQATGQLDGQTIADLSLDSADSRSLGPEVTALGTFQGPARLSSDAIPSAPVGSRRGMGPKPGPLGLGAFLG